MNNEVKIIVADDHPIFREGLIKIIQQNRNFKVCESMSNGSSALDYIRVKKPNVAVLDISMPGLSGIEISRKILEEKLSTLPII